MSIVLIAHGAKTCCTDMNLPVFLKLSIKLYYGNNNFFDKISDRNLTKK